MKGEDQPFADRRTQEAASFEPPEMMDIEWAKSGRLWSLGTRPKLTSNRSVLIGQKRKQVLIFLLRFWTNWPWTAAFDFRDFRDFRDFLRYLDPETCRKPEDRCPPNSHKTSSILALTGRPSWSILSYSYCLFYFELFRWFYQILLRFWSWQFDRFLPNWGGVLHLPMFLLLTKACLHGLLHPSPRHS